MKCPGCGYESLDLFGTCKYCGPRILRTDTAGIAALAVLQNRWGDLG